MDEERTPPYPAPAPEHLSPREIRRIENVLGRRPSTVDAALAEQYRMRNADPMGLIAQVAGEVHDLSGPVKAGVRLAWMAIAGAFTAIGFVAWLVASYVGRDTAVEYRLRAIEELRADLKSAIDRLERFRPDYPVAAGPQTSKGPPP